MKGGTWLHLSWGQKQEWGSLIVTQKRPFSYVVDNKISFSKGMMWLTLHPAKEFMTDVVSTFNGDIFNGLVWLHWEILMWADYI